MEPTLIRITRVFSWAHYMLLFAWLAAYLLFGDTYPYLGVLNLVAIYFFLLLPVAFSAADLKRTSSLWLAFSAALLAFLLPWGQLLLPTKRTQPQALPQLTVMTYNVLTWHNETGAGIDTVQAAGADVIFIRS